MNKKERNTLCISIVISILICLVIVSLVTFKKTKTITVGVIDSDMSQEYIVKYNVTTIMNEYNGIYDHSTHADMVVDVIKAKNNNCEVYLANVIKEDMTCDIDVVITALNWLKEKEVDIICMSITTLDDNATLKETISNAQSKGIIIVAACLNYSNILTYPASYDKVVSVANCYNENATISITDARLKSKLKNSNWGECSTSILTAYVTGEISKQMSKGLVDISSYLRKYN